MPATALEVGKKLVALCNANKNVDAVKELYDQNIVSIEPMAMPGMSPESKGMDAILKKHEWWYSNHEIHSGTTTGPWGHGDRFIVHFKYDVTPKVGPTAGKRMIMDETGLFVVKDGKVVKEEFFYDMEM